MNDKFQITICPTCGSDQIQRVMADLVRTFKGQSYTVTQAAIYVCPNCGERIYDHEAMSKIEACSPAYREVASLIDG